MDLTSIEQIARTNAEISQYVAFFGLLILFGILETVIARRRGEARRSRRWPVNAGITAVNVVLLGALPVSAVAMADLARDHGWGLFNWIDIAPLAALIAGFLIRSLVSWAIHLAMHKVPVFWRVHRVHHTDREMDVTTTVRLHPFELLISVPITLAVIVALGLPPLALILYEIADAALAVFSHANVRLPGWLDRSLRWVIVTPDMHRIHHSSWQPETDSNYGATLSVWDRLFGTYRSKSQSELAAMTLGLDECPESRSTSFLWLLSSPFRRLQPPAVKRTSGSGVPPLQRV